MAIFEYKAQNPRGDIVESTMQGQNRDEVAQSLISDGYKVLTIKDLSRKTAKERDKLP